VVSSGKDSSSYAMVTDDRVIVVAVAVAIGWVRLFPLRCCWSINDSGVKFRKVA
jgi:hypothetical protein